jgi:two-component system LytT family response regulator
VTPLRVLVADDEVMARRRLLRLLEAMPDVEVAGECEDATEVLRRVRAATVEQGDDKGEGESSSRIDVVLLDVQMPGLSGLDALALWPADGPVVIFCTAHGEHAVAAFDVGAVDYLLKPIEVGRLKKALGRARESDARRRFALEAERQRDKHGADAASDASLSPSAPSASSPATSSWPGFPSRLAIETRQGIVLLDPAEITHAQLDDALVTVHTTRGEFLCDLPLQELETRLAGHGFLRVHRRALLNLAQVTRLEPVETGGFVARTPAGAAVEISRSAARELRKRLKVG